MNTLLQRIVQHAETHGTAVAIEETSGRAVTYATLARRVDLVAHNLTAAGFRSGDRALLLVRPGIDAIVLLLAIMRAGGVVVAADVAMGREAFESRVRLVAPRWIVTEPIFLALQKLSIARRILRARGIEIPELPSLQDVRVVSTGRRIPGLATHRVLPDLLTPVSRTHQDVAVDGEDDAVIIFTSGTTALPKGVVHTHVSINAMLQMLVDVLDVEPSDVFYGAHLQVIGPALYGGCKVVIPRARFSASVLVADLERYHVTKSFGPPVEFEAAARYCKGLRRNLPATLRTIILGAAPVLAPFLTRFMDVVPAGTRVYCVYGLTEMLPVAMATPEDKCAYAGEGDLIGRPLPGIATRLAPDGELLIAGPHLFDRYLDGPPVRELHTGDLASTDDAGRLILHGRKKDMIIRRNYNIYPGMIEPTIVRIPGVRDCCMIGVYDDATSDEVVVLAVEKDDARADDEYRAYLEKQLLSGPYSIDLYAMPDRILFTNIPKTGRSHKADRRTLGHMVREQLEQGHEHVRRVGAR